jgi:hypothetical protein
MADHPDAWYATVAHYRAWLFADGGFYLDLQSKGGKFDVLLIRRMASYYKVTRTISKVKPVVEDENIRQKTFDRNRKTVADEVNRLTRSWKSSDLLTERSVKIVDAAERIRDTFRKHDPTAKRNPPTPYSAVSKFIWFASPKNWTPYDDLAATGLLGAGPTSKKRVLQFYADVSASFESVCENLRPVCQVGETIIWPERIVDILLMLKGAQVSGGFFKADLKADCDSFLAILPKGTCKQLCRAADEVVRRLPDDAFSNPK